MTHILKPTATIFVSLIAFFLMASSVNAQPSFWDDFEKTATEPTTISVYRSPNCECCKHWISHLEKHDFIVEDNVVMNPYAVKEGVGLPKKMASCHTAIVGDYVIEGHVPANDIKQLLKESPNDIAGLAVPEMPHGTPGMETGLRYDDFNVLSFSKNNETGVFSGYKHISQGEYQKQIP
jgi:hypothetical protein